MYSNCGLQKCDCHNEWTIGGALLGRALPSAFLHDGALLSPSPEEPIVLLQHLPGYVPAAAPSSKHHCSATAHSALVSH